LEGNYESKFEEAISIVSDEYDADIYLYSAAVDHRGFSQIVDCFRAAPRKNAVLILVTHGGLANSAYKIARFFQTHYAHFDIVIPSVCKSAGTLMACGATRLLMTPFSELGPLDVQLYARDEIGARRSGLLNHSAFEALKKESFELYEHFMLSIKRRSADAVSFPLASEVAGDMAAKMMAPIFQQVQPEALGSDYRDLQVAVEYGKRLAGHGGNIGSRQIDFLTNHYPSHDFIIDKHEAGQLFNEVVSPSGALYGLIDLVGPIAFTPQSEGIVMCLNNATEELTDDRETNALEAEEMDSSSVNDNEGPAPEGGGAGTTGEPGTAEGIQGA
jgi:hypothetical protein